MTYTIPEFKREDIQKRIARISRKAEKYGKALEVTYGEPYAKQVPVVEEQWSYADHCLERDVVSYRLVEVFDVSIDSDVVRQDGYTVVARIEHMDGGNVVNTFGDVEIKEAWLHVAGHCEHCGTNRMRRTTFIVRDQDGRDVQVGKTCLTDYCGIDPALMLARQELDEILISEDMERLDWEALNGLPRAYDVIDLLALATRLYKKSGYVKSDRPGSNREQLEDLYMQENPTEQELEQAKAMAQVIDEMDDKDAISFLLNDTRTFVRSHYCKRGHLGYIAYAPVAYEKYQKELDRRAAREAEREAHKGSEYVGEVGKRMTFEIAEMQCVTSWLTQYGRTYLYRFTDTKGNVLVWFSSGVFGKWDDDTQRYIEHENVTRIKATVKSHNERDGIKQTIITRTKIA